MITKMRKSTILLMAVLFVLACNTEKKNTKKEDTKTVKELEPIKPQQANFKISFFGIFREDGLLSINYLENPELPFNGEQYQYKRFTASDNQNKIEFELPKDVLLEKFRFSPMLESREKSSITLDSIEITYKNKREVIVPDNFLNYFKPNMFVDAKPGVSEIKFKEVERDGQKLFSPFIISNENMHDLLLGL